MIGAGYVGLVAGACFADSVATRPASAQVQSGVV
jgi:UDP-glucose 6-dehydrogenase